MEGCPKAAESEKIAPWQRKLTSITQRETQSEAAAAAGQVVYGRSTLPQPRPHAASHTQARLLYLHRSWRDSAPSPTFSLVV